MTFVIDADILGILQRAEQLVRGSSSSSDRRLVLDRQRFTRGVPPS